MSLAPGRLAAEYQLPAHGDYRTANTCIAAALTAIGILSRAQMTEHRGVRGSGADKSFLTFHFQGESTIWPGIKARDMAGRLISGKLDRDGKWDQPTFLMMAAWMACESRRTYYLAAKSGQTEQLRMVKVGVGGLCSLETSAPADLQDLRRIAREAKMEVVRVKSDRFTFSLITLGFVPLAFTADGVMISTGSVTFPNLTVELCLEAYQEIKAYNKRLKDAGFAAPPPEINLPGGPAGFHPFQFALQGLINYHWLLDVVEARANARPVLHFKGESPGRTATIESTASEEEIETAIKHVRTK